MNNLITLLLKDQTGEDTEISVEESNTFQYIIDELKKKRIFLKEIPLNYYKMGKN